MPIWILILLAIVLFSFALRYVWDPSPPEDESRSGRTSPDVTISDSFSPPDRDTGHSDTGLGGTAPQDIIQPDLFSPPHSDQSYEVTPQNAGDHSFVMADSPYANRSAAPSPRDGDPSYEVIPLEGSDNSFAVTVPLNLNRCDSSSPPEGDKSQSAAERPGAERPDPPSPPAGGPRYILTPEPVRSKAEIREAKSLYNSGVRSFLGAGRTKNTEEAVRLFRAAADLGNLDAQSKLGFCLAKGIG